MKLNRVWAIAVLICAAGMASDVTRGTVPRTAADKYPAHAEQEGSGIGAALVSGREAKKIFSVDVDRCCLVVEVALYPPKDGMVQSSLNDFSLRLVGDDPAAPPAKAERPVVGEVVAARLEGMSSPDGGGEEVAVVPNQGGGYGTGIDPVSGQRRDGGLTGRPGVGVGMGGGGKAGRHGEAMRAALHENSLPQGGAVTPVSGYIYFAVPPKKNGKYQLEYLLNGKPVVLTLR
jgi:hypothetical protein